MSDLTPFDFDGTPVRVVADDGEPWFVLADLIAVLGMGSKPSQVAARLADDEKGVRLADTPGGRQNLTVVNESGMWTVILRSDSPAAEPVRRWVTHDVLPAIRKTGAYSTTPALTGPALMAAALIEAQATIEATQTAVAELTPRAEAWDVMVSAAGDYSVDEAAKILSRDERIDIGRTRLFSLMGEIGWIYRQGHRQRWHAYQAQVDLGRLTQRMGAAFLNARTEQMEVAAPTIRITPKGVEELRRLLTARRLEAV